jgi:hypothetical protein
VDGAYAEEHVRAAGFRGEARGEVLAGLSPKPYWTSARAADAWWGSPVHFEIL